MAPESKNLGIICETDHLDCRARRHDTEGGGARQRRVKHLSPLGVPLNFGTLAFVTIGMALTAKMPPEAAASERSTNEAAA